MLLRILKKLFSVCFLLQPIFAYAGSVSSAEGLKRQLLDAYHNQAADYKPRTEHLCEADVPCYTNRLILETSPYLLQHAHNPVNWFSWNQQAFEKAKRENKPIFLSIGYAACHWCHVMEKESFDNVSIARLLNENFISIKVDREQRSDIDELYGNAVMLFQGQKGWPMSVFLTPEGKPFYGGGYYNRSDFSDLLIKTSNDWKKDEDEIKRQADDVLDKITAKKKHLNNGLKLNNELNNKAVKSLLSIADSYNGGFGEAAKFPHEPWLFLLLDNSYALDKNNDAQKTLNLTLLKMANAGINDQLSGGFHRYTTDPYWKEPHFEKMLYNQAMLIRLYLRANNIQKNPIFTQVAQQTVEFILADMRRSQGGFYAALDADTEGEEGAYYTWNLQQWQQALNDEDSLFAAEIFDIDEYGETKNESNVLYIYTALEDYARQYNLPLLSVQNRLFKIRKLLNEKRKKRKTPAIDKKIIMSWNALAITALTESSVAFNNQRYLNAAIQSANFIWDEMQDKKIKGFYRSNINGVNSQLAQLDDYVFYLQALITLYDIDKNPLWLDRAKVINTMMLKLFWDKSEGGLYNMQVDKTAPLPVRLKSAFDMTLPSANPVAAQMLLRLARRTGDEAYLEKAETVLAVFSADVKEIPSAYSSWLVVLNELYQGEKDLPVYAAKGHIRIDALMSEISEGEYKITVSFDIENNWHINSNKPLSKFLIPTQLSVKNSAQWKLIKVQYPVAELLSLRVNSQPLKLYQGHKNIEIRLKELRTGYNPVLNLQLQACNDKLCLPPQQITLYPRLLTDINEFIVK